MWTKQRVLPLLALYRSTQVLTPKLGLRHLSLEIAITWVRPTTYTAHQCTFLLGSPAWSEVRWKMLPKLDVNDPCGWEDRWSVCTIGLERFGDSPITIAVLPVLSQQPTTTLGG